MNLRRLAPYVLILCSGALAACTTTTTGESSEDPTSVALPAQEMVSSGAAAPAAPAGGAQGEGTPASPSGGDEVVEAPVAQAYKLPAWKLEDVQPKSDRFGKTYGLDAFSGRTIVVVLLEGYCPYCQSNSKVAQQLQDELTREKLDVQIVVLGDLNASQFVSRVNLPIFRDDDGEAWEAMRAKASKHDTFVFGPDGKRTYFWLGSYQGDATRWHAEVGAAARAVAKKL